MTNEELREKIKSTKSADEAWHIIENEIEQRVDLANQAKDSEHDAALTAFTSECESKLNDLKANIQTAAEIAKAQEERAAHDIATLATERNAATAALAAREAELDALTAQAGTHLSSLTAILADVGSSAADRAAAAVAAKKADLAAQLAALG